MTDPKPASTYRLQLGPEFTFAEAAAVVPYLQKLGVDWVYCSPILKARAGSTHGYDIVDHGAVNPELGGEAGFIAFSDTLRRHHMGLLLDIVPNHMGVGGGDNAWWLDVTENGQASIYGDHFDIDWRPLNSNLHDKLLLPFLGDHYGQVLEDGELRLEFHAERGAFEARYYEHRFPLDPRSYPLALGLEGSDGAQGLGAQPGPRLEAETRNALLTLGEACVALPSHQETAAEARRERRLGAARCKAELARLHAESPAFRSLIDARLDRFNGTPGEPASFDALHCLLERQPFRLSYWLVATDEVNYRRFLELNDLAGLRMERPEVFDAAHGLIRRLIAEDRVNGLRVDHPDGLADPAGYFRDLQGMVRGIRAENARPQGGAFYIVAEKILAHHERLPDHWPIDGDTGYGAAELINGLLTDPAGKTEMDRTDRETTGRAADFDAILRERKRMLLRSTLASEQAVLANLAYGLAQRDRRSRDFTHHALYRAIGEIIAAFPVYRTYVTAGRLDQADRDAIHDAVEQAKRHSPAADKQAFDFVGELLCLERPRAAEEATKRQALRFVLRFQQHTAPVMVKGMEDTALYVHNRLAALNEVGFDPRVFGVSLEGFHRKNAERAHYRPHALVCASTHDSKRGEDVRARLDVLSEWPGEWRAAVERWRVLNAPFKASLDSGPAPSNNDEYLLYQTLFGAWPATPPEAAELAAFRGRIEDYMIKAAKEAKERTAWIAPDPDYEEALRGFVQALLPLDADPIPPAEPAAGEAPDSAAFLADFLTFHRRLLAPGLLNGLSQTLLKLTVPGVPDIYQGNELWAFNLVDPDNRRPVDYDRRRAELQALTASFQSDHNLPQMLQALLARLDDGRAKLFITWKLLSLRRELPALFGDGDYQGLTVQGPQAERLCAFARRHAQREALVLAPIKLAALAPADTDPLPLGEAVWGDTRIRLPEGSEGRGYTHLFTGELHRPEHDGQGPWLPAARILEHFPVALLTAQGR